MPKPGIHYIVLQEAIAEMAAFTTTGATNAVNALQNQPRLGSAGSIGPDIFGAAHDSNETLVKFSQLYRDIKKVADYINDIFEPIENLAREIGEPVEDTVETLAPNTINLIRHTVEEIMETERLLDGAFYTNMLAFLAPEFSQGIFEDFVPGMQNNTPENTWPWFDILHYRRTGAFAEQLVTGAQSDAQKAFAYGYLSHIATDIVGHAFVNQVSGTPYRMSPQRHSTAEVFMDARAYKEYYDKCVNKDMYSRLNLPNSLPDDVIDQIKNAFSNTYHEEGMWPQHYSRNQIGEAFEAFSDMLHLLSSLHISKPTEPFSGVMDILSDALDAFDSPPSPPSSSSSSCSWGDVFSFGLSPSSRDCYDEFFEELGDWLEYLEELVRWGLETIRNICDLILAVLLSLPIAVLLAFLYAIQLLCYELYVSAWNALAMEGFFPPELDGGYDSTVRNLTTPVHCQVTNFKHFPGKMDFTDNHRHCPIPQPEQPPTAAAFHPPNETSDPWGFINQDPFNVNALRQYALAENPLAARQIEAGLTNIGNARDLTAWMLSNAGDLALSSAPDIRPVLYADWNLDADRGYGYLSWRGTVTTTDSSLFIEDEEYS